jgi:methionyl-tRNA formyltransferase
MKILFAGSGEFGLPSLSRLVEVGHEIVTVITQPDRPAGRGKKLTATPIGAFAESRQLKLIKTADINKEALAPADVMVVIAFGQKIGPHIVDHPRLGSVNLHASRLPKYRGAAPINWAILKGETVTGNSVIRLAQRMDAGAILGQLEVVIGELETAGELHDRLAQDGAPLVERVVRELEESRAVEEPQDESLATLAPKLNREASRIDWNRGAEEIANRIRGLYPWPGCHVRLIGDREEHVTLVRARPADLLGGEPGAIEDSGVVATAHDSLEILELQPEGKRTMTLAEYRNGHPWKRGMRLESLV